MNKEGGSTLTIRKSNRVTDGFKGYKATLFVGEKSYTEINIPLRGGDDLFLHGNKDAGCIGYFSGSEVLLFGSYGQAAKKADLSTSFAYQVNPIALRVGNDRIGSFVEAGLGNKGFLTAGVSLKF